ncbi:hypothetical protein [Microbacterium terrisoli]|uniref:hypothetical protein n=1 Tax=Microbacterium terrisoli TaxID=3242192 RepID=UPI0028061F41|nr:hypothetical protein [Microbacterium protaetiae]
MEGRVNGQAAAILQPVVASAAVGVGGQFVSLAMDGAVSAIVSGLDGPYLRELAGMSRSSRSDDVREPLPAAVAEAGLSPGEGEVPLISLRALAIDALLGQVPVRRLTSWAHEVIGHTGMDAAQSIAMLDDDLVENGDRASPTRVW